MLTEIPCNPLEPILQRWGRSPDVLLQVLREVQEAEGWLAPDRLAQIGRMLGVPLAQVRGVASFYSFLRSQPAGQYQVLLSDGVTDRMAGSLALEERLCQRLWVEPGHLTEDGLVSVRRTSCTGLCDQGPAALVNGRPIARLDARVIDQVADLIRDRRPLEAWPADLFRVDSIVHRTGMLLDHGLQPGEAIRAAFARLATGGPDLVLELKEAGLRGRGGAGFPTAAKWAACREAPGAARYVVCNADEGEPGTFKDRVLLTEHADLVFEGMTLAGHAVGATGGFLYLRGEYRYLLESLEATLSRRRAAGLLGPSVAGGPAFDIRIHVGAGAYVCGEESALLESLEGRRGIPRNRPPFPVTHGYRGQPTVVDNVETLCAAAWIAVHGAVAWRRVGTAASSGTKLLSVAGDCERRGIHEVPFGTTVREVLEAAGADDPLAVQVGGPSGTLVDRTEFDRRLGFEDLPTGGAFTVFGRGRDLFEVARQHVHFFAHESCGFCTPCRVGTSMQAAVMDKIHDGHGSLHELAELARLSTAIGEGAHCGLGHTAMNPVRDALARFRPAFERRLVSTDFAPAFDLDAALAPARRMTGRDDPGAHLGSDQ